MAFVGSENPFAFEQSLDKAAVVKAAWLRSSPQAHLGAEGGVCAWLIHAGDGRYPQDAASLAKVWTGRMPQGCFLLRALDILQSTADQIEH